MSSNRSTVVSYSSPGCTCRSHEGLAVRIPRRRADLLLSLFVTIGRFSEDCGWSKMRVKRYPLLAKGPW